ncbi:hypothetical protein E3N88_40004 [Mikania micrantha]|uniref:No apical meristem-associated C-terminal domain-containing protein n=1 Tax=Mikania micrantha TaxID=192012 RepID=A0A5N6LLJ1_9ASTR|nr:hypothetical protein E3N88_40004 [Mikania micrantha]
MRYTDQEYRTYHQVNSKWKNMSAKMMRFSGIYNCANNRKNDEKDDEFDIPEPVRPVGLDTTKRDSSSSRQTASSILTTNELAHQLEEFMKFQKTKHGKKLLRADLKVMGSMPPEELGNEEWLIMRKLSAKTFDKYR